MTVAELIKLLEGMPQDAPVLYKNAYDSDDGYPGGQEYSEPHVTLEVFDPDRSQLWPVLPTARPHVVIE